MSEQTNSNIDVAQRILAVKEFMASPMWEHLMQVVRVRQEQWLQMLLAGPQGREDGAPTDDELRGLIKGSSEIANYYHRELALLEGRQTQTMESNNA